MTHIILLLFRHNLVILLFIIDLRILLNKLAERIMYIIVAAYLPPTYS